ncbi:Hypothetical predicted protein [Mytilus galloprovincialis]|uniref:Uncharacterized protein n=1 Tax=Mytilus galloprovincialis TaxID=29158 RepID=A0A8B6ES10_MYTGA|nr:Hypothetical predicted protein [Mytilus galloprovincialis]
MRTVCIRVTIDIFKYNSTRRNYKKRKKVVRGVEGKELKIVCNIESNIPDIAFVMHIHGSESGRVGSGNLTYSFKPSKNDNMKSFACSAYSIFLEKHLSSKELLDIQYPTVVKIRKEVTGTKVKLTCNPRGNPENYTFADWEHWSEFKEFIRNVQGTPDGKLTLLKPNNSNRLHENDGIYKCKTSNGIEGTNGILYQKGSVVLNNKAPPIFVNANTQIQYGHYGQKMYLNVQLYNNKYDTIRTAIAKQNHPINLPGRQERIITHDRFHGINVTVPGLNITFLLTLGGIEDFADYTITACNYWGCNDFTVKVTSNCRPEPPSYVEVITYARYLEVIWDPGFDGGYQQTFYVEYQKEAENTWKRSGPVVDKRHVKMSIILNDLNPKTRYHVRMLSKNEIGKSNTTAVSSVMTDAELPKSPTNVSVIPYDRHLEVSWCPGYNTGDPQMFFIEYQQVVSEKWTRSGPIIDNMQTRMSNLLYNMTPNTRYLVRIFSRNEIGESKKTPIIDAMTLANNKSVKQVLSSQGIVILVLVIIVTVIGSGIGLCIHVVLTCVLALTHYICFVSYVKIKGYIRQEKKNRVITPTHILTTETSSDEIAHYTEIIGDDYRRTTCQENENSIISTVNVMGVDNTDTAAQSSGQSSRSFDNNIDTLEGYDDGYEKPYSTLMVQQRADDEHVYLNTNTFYEKPYTTLMIQQRADDEHVYLHTNTSYEKPYTTLMVQQRAAEEHVYLNTNTFYENATPFEKACPDRPFVENTNPSTIDKDVDKNDNDFNRSHIDPPKYKAEYINLMLK